MCKFIDKITVVFFPSTLFSKQTKLLLYLYFILTLVIRVGGTFDLSPLTCWVVMVWLHLSRFPRQLSLIQMQQLPNRSCFSSSSASWHIHHTETRHCSETRCQTPRKKRRWEWEKRNNTFKFDYCSQILHILFLKLLDPNIEHQYSKYDQCVQSQLCPYSV